MALKGHCAIALTDTKTGRQTQYEQDNLITNAPQEWFRPYFLGGSRTQLQDVTPSSLYRNTSSQDMGKNLMSMYMAGGVLLWRDALTEDASMYNKGFFDNHIVGKGTNYAVSNGDTTLGTRDTSIGWQSDGSYKSVWNFSAQQGNGTISAVSLTNAYFGRFGFGCTAYETDATVGSSFVSAFNYTAANAFSAPICSTSYYDGNRLGLLYASESRNIVGFCTNPDTYKTDGYIAISEYKTHLGGKMNLFDMSTYDILNSGEHAVWTGKLNLSDCTYGGSTTYFKHDSDGDYFMMMASSALEIPNNASFRMLRMNILTHATDVITLANTTGSSLKICVSSESAQGGAKFFDDRLITYGTISGTRYFYIVKYDGAVQQLTFGGTPISFTGEKYQTEYRERFVCFGRLCALQDHTTSPNDSYAFPYVINVQTGEVLYGNNGIKMLSFYRMGNWDNFGSAANSSGAVRLRILPDDDSISLIRNGITYRTPNIRGEINPFYINTVCNLAQPVTKTTAQAMTVTYTLTQA